MEIAQVTLHPGTHKALGKGHPWVTVDGFSKKFPKAALFLRATRSDRQSAIFLNDPRHPQVKARLWTISPSFSRDTFLKELRRRIGRSFEKRVGALYIHERENYYLVFGEADRLPGLFVLRLGPVLLIQYYALFWTSHEKQVLDFLGEMIGAYFKKWTRGACLIQKRDSDRNAAYRSVSLPCFPESVPHGAFTLREFGLAYHIFLKEAYDVGLYTDMSAFRKRLAPLFKNAASVLNLFSYTGAFSLFALKYDCRVTSVDLSPKYLAILEENLRINENLSSSRHLSMCMGVEKALQMLMKQGETFDLILCDPPSFSSDGDKTANAFHRYPVWLKWMEALCGENGHIVLFLNTHHIPMRKFKDTVAKNLSEVFRIEQELKMGEDCPVLKGFPEGNYLKCLVVGKNSGGRTAPWVL